MKTNEELQIAVQDAIKWEPLLNAAEIGVTVKNGVVTISGVVDSYSKKGEAEDAARNVAGVKAVIGQIKVESAGSSGTINYNDIAQQIISALSDSTELPKDNVKVRIEDGWVTLEGDLKWEYQWEMANSIISKIRGVKGVSNNIYLKPEIYDEVEGNGITDALRLNILVDEENIEVEILGSTVRLKGKVGSWYQKKEASKVAWDAPGVRCVENDLKINNDWLVYY